MITSVKSVYFSFVSIEDFAQSLAKRTDQKKEDIKYVRYGFFALSIR